MNMIKEKSILWERLLAWQHERLVYGVREYIGKFRTQRIIEVRLMKNCKLFIIGVRGDSLTLCSSTSEISTFDSADALLLEFEKCLKD
jgi:hypothetical protein